MASKLTPEDQARVDRVISRGTYSSNRSPVRIKTLFVSLILLLTAMSFLSYAIAWYYGVV